MDLSGRQALVVGGSRIAARRVNTLAQFCPNVTVVAPDIHPDITALAAQERVKVIERAYREDGAELVLACTDDGALNAAITGACRARGIPVNDAGDRSRCDFLFPGIARRGSVVAGVTAGAGEHALARRATRVVRQCLENVLHSDD